MCAFHEANRSHMQYKDSAKTNIIDKIEGCSLDIIYNLTQREPSANMVALNFSRYISDFLLFEIFLRLRRTYGYSGGCFLDETGYYESQE